MLVLIDITSILYKVAYFLQVVFTARYRITQVSHRVKKLQFCVKYQTLRLIN
jgi:hypothetical protein